MSTVETNGVETYYEEYGDGQPIVFLHGAISDHSFWAEQTRNLSDDFRVIVYDLRGHGKSDWPESGTASFDAFVEDLADLIEVLNLNQPLICGLSLGGMIGYRFASEYPDKLSGLVTLGARSPNTFSFDEKIVTQYFPKVMQRLSRFEWLASKVGAGFEWIFTKIYGEDSQIDREKAERIRENHSCEFEPLSDDEQEKLHQSLEIYYQLPLDFEAIAVPTLVMFGEHEPWADQHWEYLRDRIPDVAYAEIPDASHNSHVDNPEFIQNSIREFVDERVQHDEQEVAA